MRAARCLGKRAAARAGGGGPANRGFSVYRKTYPPPRLLALQLGLLLAQRRLGVGDGALAGWGAGGEAGGRRAGVRGGLQTRAAERCRPAALGRGRRARGGLARPPPPPLAPRPAAPGRGKGGRGRRPPLPPAATGAFARRTGQLLQLAAREHALVGGLLGVAQLRLHARQLGLRGKAGARGAAAQTRARGPRRGGPGAAGWGASPLAGARGPLTPSQKPQGPPLRDRKRLRREIFNKHKPSPAGSPLRW
jgi:hypothetical protein